MINSYFLSWHFTQFYLQSPYCYSFISNYYINNKDQKVINSKLFGAKSKMVEAIPNDYRPEEALFVPKAFAAD